MDTYIQKPGKLIPLFSQDEIDQAEAGSGQVVRSDEKVYMNPRTGSVDFQSGWDDIPPGEVSFESQSEDRNYLIEVVYDRETQSWIEADK